MELPHYALSDNVISHTLALGVSAGDAPLPTSEADSVKGVAVAADVLPAPTHIRGIMTKALGLLTVGLLVSVAAANISRDTGVVQPRPLVIAALGEAMPEGFMEGAEIVEHGNNEQSSGPHISAPALPEQLSEFGIIGDPYTDGTDVPCAPGTEDLGLADGYINGDYFPIRLCSLPNLPSTGDADNPNDGLDWHTPGAHGFAVVNSRVSGAWFALTQHAIAAGFTPTVFSSYRSYEQQQQIWEDGGEDPRYVAPAGFSSHGAGAGLDINVTRVTSEIADCAHRARADNDALWNWYARNSDNPLNYILEETRANFDISQISVDPHMFVFRQLATESWHLDPLKAPSRCGSDQL